ncbi:hypothetical protein GCM10009416_34370 [Craurococcus roseus]|uniref:Uncharacterized protein n=1 Tax=Craurococcus roseus TaxID=77585 RepID=A0ABN1FL57_9PROT
MAGSASAVDFRRGRRLWSLATESGAGNRGLLKGLAAVSGRAETPVVETGKVAPDSRSL